MQPDRPPVSGEPSPDLVDLFQQAIRYGIDVETDYFGNGQNDEDYIERPAREYAERVAEAMKEAHR